jgi:hypothetical protein
MLVITDFISRFPRAEDHFGDLLNDILPVIKELSDRLQQDR